MHLSKEVERPAHTLRPRGSQPARRAMLARSAAAAWGVAALLGLLGGAVRAADQGPAWHALDETALGFHVQLPAEPKKSEQEVKTPEGKVTLRQWTCPATGGAYLVFASDYPEAPADAGAVEARLDRERDDIVHSSGGTLRTETRITLDGVPGRELVVDMPGEVGSFRVRMFLKGARLHVVGAVTAKTKETAPDVERFLGSFGWSGG